MVITSSCAAIVNFAGDPNAAPQKVYTEADWNPTTWEGALTGTPNNAYQASKKFAEQSGKFKFKWFEGPADLLESLGLCQKR